MRLAKLICSASTSKQQAGRGLFCALCMNTKLDLRRARREFVPMAAFLLFAMAGCSKVQPASVLGDASHPAPVHFYTVAEETARRRIQPVGSLSALAESTLSSEAERRLAEVVADVGDSVR